MLPTWHSSNYCPLAPISKALQREWFRAPRFTGEVDFVGETRGRDGGREESRDQSLGTKSKRERVRARKGKETGGEEARLLKENVMNIHREVLPMAATKDISCQGSKSRPAQMPTDDRKYSKCSQ